MSHWGGFITPRRLCLIRMSNTLYNINNHTSSALSLYISFCKHHYKKHHNISADVVVEKTTMPQFPLYCKFRLGFLFFHTKLIKQLRETYSIFRFFMLSIIIDGHGLNKSFCSIRIKESRRTHWSRNRTELPMTVSPSVDRHTASVLVTHRPIPNATAALF